MRVQVALHKGQHLKSQRHPTAVWSLRRNLQRHRLRQSTIQAADAPRFEQVWEGIGRVGGQIPQQRQRPRQIICRHIQHHARPRMHAPAEIPQHADFAMRHNDAFPEQRPQRSAPNAYRLNRALQRFARALHFHLLTDIQIVLKQVTQPRQQVANVITRGKPQRGCQHSRKHRHAAQLQKLVERKIQRQCKRTEAEYTGNRCLHRFTTLRAPAGGPRLPWGGRRLDSQPAHKTRLKHKKPIDHPIAHLPHNKRQHEHHHNEQKSHRQRQQKLRRFEHRKHRLVFHRHFDRSLQRQVKGVEQPNQQHDRHGRYPQKNHQQRHQPDAIARLHAAPPAGASPMPSAASSPCTYSITASRTTSSSPGSDLKNRLIEVDSVTLPVREMTCHGS
nr:hypothetical protein [uncultured bacterium]